MSTTTTKPIDRTSDRADYIPEAGELVFARCYSPNAELIRGLDRDHPNPAHPDRIGLAVSCDTHDGYGLTSGWFLVRRVRDGMLTLSPSWDTDRDFAVRVQGIR